MNEEYPELLSRAEERRIRQQLLGGANGESPDEDSRQSHIEKVLLERIDGPFVPLDDNFAERVKERFLERLMRKRQRNPN